MAKGKRGKRGPTPQRSAAQGRGRPQRNQSRSQRPHGQNQARGKGARADDVRSGSTGEGRRHKGPGGDRVEGRQAVRELLLANKRRVREIVFQEGLDSAAIIEDIEILAADQGVSIKILGRGAFDAYAQTESSQGVLADADPLETVEIEDLIEGDNPFLVMVDGVTDPHNLGAIFRSADASGADGIILPKHRSARITPTVAKSSVGAIEHVPVANVAGVPAAIQILQKHNVWVIGLDEAADRSIFEFDIADQPLCLVLGAEGPGLSRLTRERCDALVSIPMQGAVASLNVSTAATVAMFDVARRRLGGLK